MPITAGKDSLRASLVKPMDQVVRHSPRRPRFDLRDRLIESICPYIGIRLHDDICGTSRYRRIDRSALAPIANRRESLGDFPCRVHLRIAPTYPPPGSFSMRATWSPRDDDLNIHTLPAPAPSG